VDIRAVCLLTVARKLHGSQSRFTPPWTGSGVDLRACLTAVDRNLRGHQSSLFTHCGQEVAWISETVYLLWTGSYLDIRAGCLPTVDRKLYGSQSLFTPCGQEVVWTTEPVNRCGQEVAWTSEPVYPVWTGSCVDLRVFLCAVDRKLRGPLNRFRLSSRTRTRVLQSSNP
jgi:hypothetical protein